MRVVDSNTAVVKRGVAAYRVWEWPSSVSIHPAILCAGGRGCSRVLSTAYPSVTSFGRTSFSSRLAVEGWSIGSRLAPLRGDKTIQEIAVRHKVHPNQVSTWKQRAV